MIEQIVEFLDSLMVETIESEYENIPPLREYLENNNDPEDYILGL